MIAVALALAAAAGGCSTSEERSPAPPPVANPAGTGPAPAPRPPAGGRAPATPAPGETTRPAEPPDYWVNRFGGYMTTDFKVEYLSTPEAERFEKYGERLLEFQRREALLERYRGRLTPAEIERYRALPDYESSARFLEGK